MESCPSAVAVRGAWKRYSPTSIILRGLNLTVPHATIYGLLGPSGCGKTTLLRSIVGITRLDAGEIFVKAKKKNNVGYMPQDLGLYDYMTIMEAFEFYGKLYSLERDQIETRGQELISFLELPDRRRLISTLSGGQQRRLSLAVTLIHDPDLLILDEPTVGIDPVLSAAIWERLVEMTSCHRKTIIITTHYIEEARQAHMIGLLRDGVLLAEQPPLALMSSQGCDTLEDAFLTLSRKQADVSKNIISFPAVQKKLKPAITDSSPYWKTNRFMAQLNKNTKWLKRNYYATLLFMLMPGTISLMCQLILGQDPGNNRSLGIVSPELTKGLYTCTSLQYGGCDDLNRPLTCRLLDYLTNSTLKPVIYDSFEEAKKATQKGDVWGVLTFSNNFTDSVRDRLLENDFYSTPDGIVESSFVNAHMDMSNMWVSTFLRKELIEDVRRMIRDFLQDCSINPKVLDIPVQFQPAVHGTNNPTFLQFFIPGVTCTFAFYLAIMYTTGAIMFEKSVGLERSLVAGMTKLEVVNAHCLVQIGIAITQELSVLAIFYTIFDNPLKGNIYLITLLLVMLQIMGTFFGLILGLAFKSQRDATNAGVGAVNFLFMTAGMMWPVEGMHYVLRKIVWMFPVQPAVEAYRGIAMRNWTLSHPVVYQGFLSTTVWTAIFIIITILICRGNKTSL